MNDNALDLSNNKNYKIKKSIKLPDPPIFTDGVDPIWDDWLAKVREKLNINADYYTTSKLRVVYILTRIGGKAVIYIYYRREKDLSNLYEDFIDVLEELAERYKDIDRLENVCRGLARL